MLLIAQNQESQVVLQAESGELPTGPEFNDVLLAFTVATRSSNQVILEVGNQVAEAIDFITAALISLHLEIQLSSELQEIVNRQASETELVQRTHDAATESEDEPTLPDDAAINLLPHQKRGLRRALRVENLAEFSVQGSGKTAVALAAYSVWKARGEIQRLLIIGPASCFQPWEDEAIRCLGQEVHTIRWSGAASERMRLVPAFSESDLILCTYDTARRDVEMLTQLLRSSPTLLVLDESHYIKSFNLGARATAVLKLAPYAAKRMILTGTPTPHSLEDLWTQFNFLWPSGGRTLLGTRQQYLDFLARSRRPARELRERLTPFFHRTTQEELNLPPAEAHFIERLPNQIPMEQVKIIRLLEMRILAEARLRVPSIRDRQVLAKWQEARIIRLLQAASNPGLLMNPATWSLPDVGDVEISDMVQDVNKFRSGELIGAKIQWAVEKARELVGQGEKIILWTWWVENLHLLEQLLQDLNPLLLYGGIKPYEEDSDEEEAQSRERNIREFKTRVDRPVLIANPAACAESISLHQICHHAIYVDRTFNCGQFLQSLNRIRRVGLAPDILTHYWLPFVDCAIERSVDQRLSRRQRVMYELLDDNTPVFAIDPIEETDTVDSAAEIGEAFQVLTEEIERGGGAEASRRQPS